MRTRMGYNITRIALRIDDGTPITLRWTTLSGGTIEPTTGELEGATATANTATIKGLVHFISPAMTGYQHFTELTIGDAILVLDPEADIDGKPNLIFEIDGQQWQQKSIGDQTAKALDAMYGSVRVSRVVAITLRA